MDDKMLAKAKELDLLEFNFDARVLKFLIKKNINKDKLINMEMKDFYVYDYYDYKNIIYELLSQLKRAGYTKLKDSYYIKPKEIYHNLGYKDEFKFPELLYNFVVNNGIPFERLTTMTYDELAKYKGLGYSGCEKIKTALNNLGFYNIIMGKTLEQIKMDLKQQKKELAEKYINLVLSNSNLDSKNNKSDRLILNEFKKNVRKLPQTCLEKRMAKFNTQDEEEKQ